MIYLDTHILVWLYSGMIEKIPPKIQALIERHELLASPISILELQYLQEIKRITVSPQEIINYLKAHLNLILDENMFTNIVEQSLKLTWTRDPFDRLIVASAELRRIHLITKDHTILTHCPIAIWDQI